MKYKELLENYVKMMDIAIWSLKKFDTMPLNGKQKSNFCEYYENEKSKREEIKSGKFASVVSLKYDISDALIFFNETSNEAVEQFWEKIQEEELTFKRENKLKKVLKRKRIKDDLEYDFVIDVMIPYKQEGLISDDEVLLLNQYIGDYEAKFG